MGFADQPVLPLAMAWSASRILSADRQPRHLAGIVPAKLAARHLTDTRFRQDCSELVLRKPATGQMLLCFSRFRLPSGHLKIQRRTLCLKFDHLEKGETFNPQSGPPSSSITFDCQVHSSSTRPAPRYPRLDTVNSSNALMYINVLSRLPAESRGLEANRARRHSGSRIARRRIVLAHRE
jgi:hypothetical protein